MIQKARTLEERKFRMHPDLLFSVIQSQAGTPAKAMLEAVMNAVDAGATRCDLTFSEVGFRIEDNGQGFTSRQEIEEFFETFGTPHKEGDATFGRFRMGRGQLFSFASTVWRSGDFRMAVDIKNKGLSYDLETDLPTTSGCIIVGQWYEQKTSSAIRIIMRDTRLQIAWIDTPVYIDGRRANQNRHETQWTYEDENFLFLREENSDLAIYNLGAFVKTEPEAKFGFGGHIVSKKPLQINFARNDILLDYCFIWQQIQDKLYEFTAETLKKKAVLTNSERRALLQNFWNGDISYCDIRTAKVLRDATGSYRSFADIATYPVLSFAHTPLDYTNGDRLIQTRQAMVIRASELEQFDLLEYDDPAGLFLDNLCDLASPDCSAEEMISSIAADGYLEFSSDDVEAAHDFLKLSTISIVDIKDLSLSLTHDYKLLNLKEQSHDVKATISALKKAIEHFAIWNLNQTSPELSTQCTNSERKRLSKSMRRDILVAETNVAEAFTDGSSFIAFNIKVIKAFTQGATTLDQLLHLLCHECCHCEATNNTHLHSPEFHEKFHELIMSTAFTLMRNAFEATFRARLQYDGPELSSDNDYNYLFGVANNLIKRTLGSTFALLPTRALRALRENIMTALLQCKNDGQDTPIRPAVNYAYWATHNGDNAKAPSPAPLAIIDTIIAKTMPPAFFKIPAENIDLLRNALTTNLIDSIELAEFRKLKAERLRHTLEKADAEKAMRETQKREAENYQKAIDELKVAQEIERERKLHEFIATNADVLSTHAKS